MRFCANTDCDEILAPTSPAAAVYCGPCGRRSRKKRERKHGRARCAYCRKISATEFCSAGCRELLQAFVSALRETLGFEPFQSASQHKVEEKRREHADAAP